jgi:DNA-binding NarL/FixJ family response regulator
LVEIRRFVSLGNSASLTSDGSTKLLFKEVLTRSGYDDPQNFDCLAVAKIAQHAPRAMLVDLDNLQTDRLECVRQLRFVLPQCAIVVVSSDSQEKWAAQCHLAGASGVLSRGSVPRMLAGLRRAVRHGCYTDPSFIKPAPAA